MADWRSWLRRAPHEPAPPLAGMELPREERPVRFWQKRDFSVTDAVLVGIGVGLAAAAATFPWYVFMNQEKFGYTVVEFEQTPTESDLSGPFYTQRVQWRPKPVTEQDMDALALDLAATGTVVGSIDRELPDPGPETQPFPGLPPSFKLVHVAKGRAMISDANGFFVVERGSVLPDNSRVVSIENADGKWLLKTSREQVVELVE
ncbi:hypothetical protein [Aquibium microcysteis]|uniref:hypothetical protein n=1 Tax=Aquibium microcysteis TaxID=675281 RepID=UPI00165D1B0C|nr:hypothetical protein [Aquibium microcysteis]